MPVPKSAYISLPDDAGPALAALDERRRKFVTLYVHGGYSQTEAAKAAGYMKGSDGALQVQASRLMRERRVLDAMREEAERHLDATAIRAVKKIGRLVDAKSPKVSGRAIDSVLDRRGFSRRTEQMVSVERRGPKRSAEQLLEAVLEKLRAHKLVALPAPIEGEFSEVSRETIGGSGDETGS